MKINWASESLSTLNAYRVAHRLDTPSAYQSPTAAAVLEAPGIGKYSPTMVRRKEKHKVSKEHLATAVRKHFNAVAVTETDVLVDFINRNKNQGR